MTKRSRLIGLVADFNVEALASVLELSPTDCTTVVRVAPFGQVVPVLTDPSHPFWAERFDALVIWTRPDGVSPAYAGLLQGSTPETGAVAADAGMFARAVASASDRARMVLVLNWTLPPWRSQPALSAHSPNGTLRALLEMNTALSEHLTGCMGVHVLDTGQIAQGIGPEAFSDKLWYMAKQLFGNMMLREVAQHVHTAIGAGQGESRKLVILDLDETLWGGIVGDLGWSNLRLGGHDPLGEALVDFQRALLALKRRGVLLAIVSKNQEKVALEAIERHPEMILRSDDFVAWRINWEDKATNIVDLVRELNLGLQSVVFIDDSPAERARVREALPEVLVPEWPADKTEYVKALSRLDCLTTLALTAEDAARTRMLQEERLRAELRTKATSPEEWIGSLGIACHAQPLSESNLERTAQLMNKTNQMNLSTRRLQPGELLEWARDPRNAIWSVRVSDRFGDYGITGIVSVTIEDKEARLIDFVLSCRVFGRAIEETLVHIAAEHARQSGARQLVARMIPTAKNKPCEDFLRRSGMTPHGGGVDFSWSLCTPYQLPGHVTLRRSD